MNRQHFQEVSLTPVFQGLRVDGEAFFFDEDGVSVREESLSTTIGGAYFQQGTLWIMTEHHGPFFIASLYDVSRLSHLKGLAHVLAAAFVDERSSCE